MAAANSFLRISIHFQGRREEGGGGTLAEKLPKPPPIIWCSFPEMHACSKRGCRYGGTLREGGGQALHAWIICSACLHIVVTGHMPSSCDYNMKLLMVYWRNRAKLYVISPNDMLTLAPNIWHQRTHVKFNYSKFRLKHICITFLGEMSSGGTLYPTML